VEFSAFELVKFVYAWLLLSVVLFAGRRQIFVAKSDEHGEPALSRGRVFILVFVVMMVVSSTDDFVATTILGSLGS